jgi:uncharacterized membrane protein YidH (DUF202 family)
VNIVLWILQILLALHTLMGAVWKVSNSEQAVGSLKALPHAAWLSLIVVELLCSLALVVPAFSKRLGGLVPVAAGCIAAEMLLFTGLNLASGDPQLGQIAYWLVVAAICGFLAWGRVALKPIAAPKS